MGVKIDNARAALKMAEEQVRWYEQHLENLLAEERADIKITLAVKIDALKPGTVFKLTSNDIGKSVAFLKSGFDDEPVLTRVNDGKQFDDVGAFVENLLRTWTDIEVVWEETK